MKIFGYGSLINSDSLYKTIEAVVELRKATLLDHIRLFESDSRSRRSETGGSVSVLNIRPLINSNINGVWFEISSRQLEKLQCRESGYTLERVDFFDQEWGRLVTGYTFVDYEKIGQRFVHNDCSQLEYLEICLKGAYNQGIDFYTSFINSTIVEGQILSRFLKSHGYLASYLSKKYVPCHHITSS